MLAEATKANWWKRESGGREVLALALPLMISSGFLSLMLFIDRMFLFWHSPPELAAAMPAGMCYWTLLCFPLVLVSYVNTFVAQYHGVAQPQRIGTAVSQGIWLGISSLPLFLCLIPLAPMLFRFFEHPEEVLKFEVVYFQFLMLGAGAGVISAAQATYYTGRGITRVEMYISVASTCLNALLDYVLIFGAGGFPELGIAGAAIATAIAQWIKVIAYFFLLRRPAVRNKFFLPTSRRLDFTLMRRIVRYGGPSGLQFFVESLAFTWVIFEMGQNGVIAMAATTLAFNINSVAFIPMNGISIAVSILVGQKLTASRVDLAARATWTALVIGLLYTGIFAAAYLAIPDWFLWGHARGADPETFSAVRDVAVVLLRFVAVYCIFDSMQLVFVGAIKGAGDTWFVLRTTVWISTIGLLIGTLGERQFAGGLYWWWSLIAAWIFLLGVIYLGRFQQGKWREMRVIESEFNPKT